VTVEAVKVAGNNPPCFVICLFGCGFNSCCVST